MTSHATGQSQGAAPRVELHQARPAMERDGFVLGPRLVPLDTLPAVVDHMDAVIAGEYETGVPPTARLWNPGDDPTKLVKIDNPHVCDDELLRLVCTPELGRWAAELMGADMVQVWEVQLLFKPPGGSTGANVGWHQDQTYWQDWMDGEVFTAWVAVADVPIEAGAVRFVRGSHHWGHLGGENFFIDDLDGLRDEIQSSSGKEWDEVPAVLQAGEASFHHKLTLHGSMPNLSDQPRRGFAVHLRTERSRPLAGAPQPYPSALDDPRRCPVIFSR